MRQLKHKVFVSYHHGKDQYYKDNLVKLAEENNIFIDMSVDTGDISNKLSDKAIRKKIRDEYLKDSTVTIVLIGAETKSRKHVDWEIYSSMYDGTINKKSGIIAIVLPEAKDSLSICAPHGQKERDLYSGEGWISVDSRDEYERRYPHMPDRLIDNLNYAEAKISVVPWSDLTLDILNSLIEMAFNNRTQCEYDLSRPMRRKNS